MRLISLELQGFKSFPERTKLNIDTGMTVVVGPNGSGKSNISDAIRWVLGELSSKNIRGTKMEDVIFAGTDARRPMGYAEVSLTFDNTVGEQLPIDYDEVTVTRKYYRSGDSEYMINRKPVRLKDITELFMNTGLGKSGYSIIGQGRIAEIVSTKSTDRREVFEEAAGISRFRYRKEEAERKLQRTEENLLRINDKIEELEMQVGPLKKQSETAKKYLLLRDELRVEEISAWMATLDKLHEQSGAVAAEHSQLKKSLEQAKAELEALYTSSDSISERMHQKDIEAERARERLSAAESEAAQCESFAAVLRADVKSSEESMARMLGDIMEQEKRTAELEKNISASAERMGEIDRAMKALEEEAQSSGNVIEGCRMKLKSREQNVEMLSEKANRIAVDCHSMDARIKLLGDMEKDFEGYSKAVKTVMRESQRGNLKGVRAPVANLVKADDECALAIETALGAASQNIVVDSQNDGRHAIELLKRYDSGRATFLPIDTIRGSVMKDAPVNDPGFVGIAYELVKFDKKYDDIIANLLGRTVIAEAMTDAIRMSRNSGNRLRIVTLDGQMINAGGSMTGGSSVKNSGIISRANELEKLSRQRVKLGEDEKTCSQNLERAKAELASVRYQLEMAQNEQNDIRTRASSLEAERRATEASASQLRLLLDSLSSDSETRRSAVDGFEQKIASLNLRLSEKERELASIREKAKTIRDEINEISQRKIELEGKRSSANKQAQSRSGDIMDLERSLARVEQKKLAAEMEEKQILDKLWENYELSHSAACSIRKPVENLAKANRHISELRREISALGTPNIGAIEEYERVNTRYEFLSEQRQDIDKAKAELVGIIKEITGQMEAVFIERFRQIDEAFRQTFLELFGGGKAALKLEDEKDVLNCGIEIKVQPPGKALTNLSLLSGGEMSFVAIALYFAILKVRPTPFCVMDEIEAALDDANVNRYADYMRRMADKTQFLVITHRRGTMEEADMLYGVTMQEKGVSTVIELDLESAQKTIEE